MTLIGKEEDYGFETEVFKGFLVHLGEMEGRDKRTGDDDIYENFLQSKPMNKLAEMTIEDYVIGKDSVSENFCWWLEYGLQKVIGSFAGGSSQKHYMFRRKDTGDLELIPKLEALSAEQAMSVIAKQHHVIANVDINSNFTWLNDEEILKEKSGTNKISEFAISENRILRILCMYHIDDLLPIYSTKHIANVLSLFGHNDSKVPSKEKTIERSLLLRDYYYKAKKQYPNLTTWGFGNALYNSNKIGIEPKSKKLIIYDDKHEISNKSKVKEKNIHAQVLHSYLFLGKSTRTIEKEIMDIDPKPRGGGFECQKILRQYDVDESRKATLSTENFSDEYKKSAGIYKNGLDLIKEFYDLEKAGFEITENSSGIYRDRNIPLNQILFGPPGTGKTYKTVEMAVEIADPNWLAENESNRIAIKAKYDELVDERRIVFTTFHQSFAYEDFIEGIRASSDNEQKQIEYAVEDGVFKQLCIDAAAKTILESGDGIDLSGRKTWKMSLGDTTKDEDDVYQECLENSYVLLGYGESIDFSGCDAREDVKNKLEQVTGESHDNTNYSITSVNTFKNIISIGDLIIVSDGNRRFRAIGEVTGNYQFLDNSERGNFQQSRSVNWLRLYEPSLPKEKLFKKSLSQMTIYELRDKTIDREKLSHLLARQEQVDQSELPHVIIIDEINRGNIARIFGELITLLEPTKRKGEYDSREVVLPYSKESFSVPSNVYVIGTMNTADKSLAQLDLALRRRFNFIEVPPQTEKLAEIQVHGVEIDLLLSFMNQRIEVLLDKDHLIGHSYFLGLSNMENDQEREIELSRIFKQNIIPLLQEYFFDDWERISWVLNDHEKSDEHSFISKCGELSVSNLFNSSVVEQVNDRRYTINDLAFNDPMSYARIVQENTA